MDKQMLPKRKLEIVKVHEDKPYGDGGKSLLPINAKDLSLPEHSPLHGKSLRFVVFNPALVEYIKKLVPGDVILADYEEQPSKNADYPNNLNIVQIYDAQGNPISAKKFGGGGYRGGGKSPEEIASDEAQVAVKAVLTYGTESLKSDYKPDERLSKLILKALDWCERKIDYRPPPKPEPAKPAVAKAAEPHQTTQDKQGSIDKPEPAESPIKHAGDLLTRASKLEPAIGAGEVLTILSINDMKEITDLQAAWSSIIIYHRSRLTAQQGADKLFE